MRSRSNLWTGAGVILAGTMMLAWMSGVRADISSLSAPPAARQAEGAIPADADQRPIVTIKTEILDEDGQTVFCPVLSLFVGQRGELQVLRNNEEGQTETMSFAIHVMEVDGPFYQVQIEAEDTAREAEWSFRALTYLRADQESSFRLLAGEAQRQRTLNVTLFETRPANERKKGH